MIPEPTEAMLPCPFCGSAAFSFKQDNGDCHVECTGCSNRTSYWDTMADAITKWNTREPEAGKLREALEDARAAIASLDEFALGGVDIADTHTGDSVGQYGIRDELLAKIDAALSRNQGR
jgi:Lar family restriction alleviation protein